MILSAVSAGKDDIREIVEKGRGQLGLDKKPKVLFWMKFIGLIKASRIFFYHLWNPEN
jgi:hypothetical protein